MKAVWYEKQGAAREVLIFGDMPDPEPGPGEVRIRVAASGISPGDVKKRQNAFDYGMPYPRVIPHSDGAGTIDRVGPGVSEARRGERTWCYGAQSYRPFGTAAEFVVVPAGQAVPLPDSVPFEQGACLGIPGITAHRAVHVGGPVEGRTVLVQGGAGSVGACAVQLAQRAGAHVVATVRSAADEAVALRAGATQAVRTDGIAPREVNGRLHASAPDGFAHIVEVAFDVNIASDVAVLAQGGSVAAYGTAQPSAAVPVWEMAFKNVRLFFLGSDDFPAEAKAAAARDLSATLAGGWPGFEIGERFPLSAVAAAHEYVEQRRVGRVVLVMD
jgi:NADPH2:quinone reductase